MEIKRRRRLLLAATICTIAILGGWWLFGRHDVPAGQPPLATLDAATFGTFQVDFNAASDQTRIILLLSPT